MQKSIFKSKFILFVIAAIAVAVSLLLFARPEPARAEGNNAGAEGDASVINITVDVNGRSQDNNERDDVKANIAVNNNKSFRKRFINSAAVIESIDPSNTNAYTFNPDTLVNDDDSIAVSLESAQNTVLVIEGIKLTEESANIGPAYFSIGLVSRSGADVTAKFCVTVKDTFVPIKNGTVSGPLYVGNKIKIDDMSQEESPSIVNGARVPIMSIDNYSSVTIDLAEHLQGRALYSNLDPVKSDNVSNNFWVINSVTNFEIESVSFRALARVTLKNMIRSKSTPAAVNVPPVRISPTATGDLEVDSETIRNYNEENKNADFWSNTHTLELRVKEIGSDTSAQSYTLYIPIRFVPANPQVVNISSSLLRLNVTSENILDISSGNILKKDGTPLTGASDYGSIYIRPSDLIEYSFPSSYRDLTFFHQDTKINGSTALTTEQGCHVERIGKEQEEDTTIPTVYKVSGHKSSSANNSFSIEVTIVYGTGPNSADDRGTITLDFTVTTYGGYDVLFAPINGKKSVSYNILNSSVFAEMRERGYQLTGAESNNPKQLSVSLSNGVLTLKPMVDAINGQTTADIKLTFTSTSNETITFNSGIINIDVNAGSLFARFDDWQAWLIIAACIVGGLLLILLFVWLFIRSISKHKQDELATQAPVSSYIVKLNSTIAATQAQQRMAQTQTLSQMSSQMLLGAGPTGTAAAPPDTLQLASGMPSMPSSPSTPLMSEPQAAIPPDNDENLEELIAKYITDEELLERIFTEKYEPKGMIRRTFFKSKDLQTRELDKEKKRIIERYKSPMPMDEAIMSENEIKNAAQSSSPAAMSTPQATEPQQETEMFALDFDPDSPLYVESEKPHDEFSEEKIDIDASPEETRFKAAERRNDIILKELEELKNRLDKVQAELDRAKSLEDELREKINKAETDDAQYGKDIEELEFKLASAKNKDKERITRDIGIKEEKKNRNLEDLERLRAELDALLGNSDKLNVIFTKLDDIQSQKTAERDAIAAELEKARAEYEAYMERLAQVQARQELEAKVKGLSPLLSDVNNTDYELRRLQSDSDKLDKERESLKTAVANAKSQILGATDFDVINDLNTQISDANARISDLEKETTKATKRKSELNIEFNAQRRKANDFVEKNNIPLEEVIKAEDSVIGNIELELLKAVREKDKEEAEKAVANAQAVYDDLAASANDVTFIAMEVASNIKAVEDEIEAAQAELDEVNAKMEAATDDERLMLIVEQGDKTDKLEELKARLEQENIEGTKRKMEAQSEYDAKLDEARHSLNEANEEFERACSSFDELVNNTNPLDLIVSGSGIISQDQKKIEAENLKKQLERSKNEIEQARLAAEMAQKQAEQARLDAERASEEARLEAERSAQEAIERAEQARIEAEEKARAEVEAAERAKQEAEAALAAEAEEAKRKAEEEAEEAKRKAEEEAEAAKRKAEEDAEEAKRKAEEEAEEAKRKAQEEIEEMRRKAEEEAEAKRLEEENKRKEEEERQKAENERNETIAKKVAMRKEQIIAIRNEMKELKGDEDAKHLRERLYNIQLTYDEDERGSSELMDFYNKTMDDIQNSGEIARLKAENAKKPQRVVRKVTERVNRIAKRKPGARPAGAKAGARPARPGARPAGARPAGARPARPGARPAGARPAGARPARPGARPARPGGPRPPRPKA